MIIMIFWLFKGSVLPAGYSKVNIHYKISLTEDGRIDELIDCQKDELIELGNKTKKKKVPVEMVIAGAHGKAGDRRQHCGASTVVYFWFKPGQGSFDGRMTGQIRQKNPIWHL